MRGNSRGAPCAQGPRTSPERSGSADFPDESPDETPVMRPVPTPGMETGEPLMVAIALAILSSVQPVIDQPADTLHFAGYSIERFSGFSSTASGEVMRWDWSYGDGTYGVGPEVAHVYAAPGTYTVMLTVRDDAGDVGSTTTSVTIVALPGTDYFVAADGSDSNDGKSAATPWATLDKAFGTLGSQRGVPPRIFLRRGDTFTWPSS